MSLRARPKTRVHVRTLLGSMSKLRLHGLDREARLVRLRNSGKSREVFHFTMAAHVAIRHDGWVPHAALGDRRPAVLLSGATEFSVSSTLARPTRS